MVQTSWRRAGWYSDDRIDNDRIPSADRVIAELKAFSGETSGPKDPAPAGL